MEIQSIMIDIEDRMMPYFHFDIWERGMYYFLFRHTVLIGKETEIVPLSAIAEALGCSEWQARKSIRQLAQKGCIELDQTRKGHKVKVLVPEQLAIPDSITGKVTLDIEVIDFFKNREYVKLLLEREDYQCFYCSKKISEESCELDHVLPQAIGGDNSYRNIVAACHRCNTIKQGNSAENHLRQLYRNNLIDDKELNERLQTLQALKNGSLKPKI